MKKMTIYFLVLAAIVTAMTSCTDELNQRPVIETDAEGVYSQAANYKNVRFPTGSRPPKSAATRTG